METPLPSNPRMQRELPPLPEGEPTPWLLLKEDDSVYMQVMCIGNPVTGPNAQYDWPANRVKEVSRLGDLAIESLKPNGWQPDAEKAETHLLAGIDIDREARAQETLNQNQGIAYVHKRKREEARAWLCLTTERREELAFSEDLQLLFYWLAGEADTTGQSMDELARMVLVQANKADTVLNGIDKKALRAKKKVREATSVKQMKLAAEDPFKGG